MDDNTSGRRRRDGYGSLLWLGFIKERRWPSLYHQTVMFVMADYIDEHDMCWPAQARLAAEAGMSERKVRSVLADLESWGVITRASRVKESGRGRTSDAITLVREGVNALPLAWDLPAPRAVRSSDLPARADTTYRHARAAEEPREQPRDLSRVAPPPTTPHDRAFETVWEHYPRKTKKVMARKAFVARLRAGVSLPELAEATRNYAKATRGKDPEFIMHGATFYGPNENWKDYLPGGPGIKSTRRDIPDRYR